MPKAASARGGSASVSSAGRKRVNNTPKSRTLSSSSKSTPAAARSVFHTAGKYPIDYWYWLLSFALPAGFARCLAVIETFEAYFYDKNAAFNPIEPVKQQACWYPFAAFLHFACELLLPLDPFGGFGGGKSVRFWGQNLSRNQVIGKIISKATGIVYDHKRVSSHKQMIVKTLLCRYISHKENKDGRGRIAEALQQLAGTTKLERYLGSYLKDRDGSGDKTPEEMAARLLVLEQRTTIEPLPKTWCPRQKVLSLHPLLAFFLGLNGNSAANASVTEIFRADQAIHEGQTSSTFGRAWWNQCVMTNSNEKADYMELWWCKKIANPNFNPADFYREHGHPPASDEVVRLDKDPAGTSLAA
ncbi:hypothetical protein QFC22_004538 [Naganishia vaughanmartiniae]|uniref:Uncharacterized protein n=1 Tax=Naganishia vaughanmartiniae TaxID=1424756 RepID=A0ACC2X0E3_9TREE|nr:hypothetical protein QFC22_004538 [Naganishia vaughanmartiniae]